MSIFLLFLDIFVLFSCCCRLFLRLNLFSLQLISLFVVSRFHDSYALLEFWKSKSKWNFCFYSFAFIWFINKSDKKRKTKNEWIDTKMLKEESEKAEEKSHFRSSTKLFIVNFFFRFHFSLSIFGPVQQKGLSFLSVVNVV